ncbi:hypothetical protein ACHHYP_17062 [Achlya hypogyna]|uniref:Uncharacterized protein n=1 Tax=Achlya hypogyna TaxID=1202772 RepID=A0A1V9Y5B7_ACHHY|nr:hypothetical protein ACHHYP_17062 [Achlya hypogyna]
MLWEVVSGDLPHFLGQVRELQESHAKATKELALREARILELEKQVAGLQKDYLELSLESTSREQDSRRRLLLSCIQATTHALAHGHQLNPTTQIPVLQAIDEFLQDMLDTDVDQKTLQSITATLGSLLHDPSCLLLPSIVALVHTIFIKLTLVAAMIPASLLPDVVPIFSLMTKSSWGTSVLVGCNFVGALLAIMQSGTLQTKISQPIYIALLSLLQHLLDHTGYRALNQQHHDDIFAFFKVYARRLHEEFRKSQS